MIVYRLSLLTARLGLVLRRGGCGCASGCLFWTGDGSGKGRGWIAGSASSLCLIFVITFNSAIETLVIAIIKISKFSTKIKKNQNSEVSILFIKFIALLSKITSSEFDSLFGLFDGCLHFVQRRKAPTLRLNTVNKNIKYFTYII